MSHRDDAHPDRHDNNALLGACPGLHDFRLIARAGEAASRAKWRCTRCNGVVSETAYTAWTKGAKAGFKAGEEAAWARYREQAERLAARVEALAAEVERLQAEAAPDWTRASS